MGEARALLEQDHWLTNPDLERPSDWYDSLESVVRPVVEAWASTMTKMEAAQTLTDAGIAAGPVHTPGDVINDPHLRHAT